MRQVFAMIIASSPPLAIVAIRMLKDRTFDSLGFVAGISFFVSGIVSIAEPDEKVGSICESLVMLLVGVFCVISVFPIKIGSFELKPFVFQFANQIMPRTDETESLQTQDVQHLHTKPSGQQRLDYLYRHMARFRQDMRVMTCAWGIILIAAFIIKVIVVMTDKDIFWIQMSGYIVFGLAAFFMMVFTWFYTRIVKGHVMEQIAFWKEDKEHAMDKQTETAHNLNWSVQTMNNTFGQLAG